MMCLPGRIAATGLAVALIGPVPSRADEVALLPRVLGASELFSADARSGTALSGFDPVTYFTEKRPKVGVVGLEVMRDGLIWRFASSANRAAFLRDPEAFLPSIGGYDPLGATRRVVVTSSPSIYAVRNGHLYLFRNEASRGAFLSDPELAAQAERIWPELRGGLVKD